MRTVLAVFFGSLGLLSLVWFLVLFTQTRTKPGEQVRLILMLACFTSIALSVIIYRTKPKG